MRLTRNLSLALCLLLIVAACSGSAERRFLSLGSAPPGGAFFVVGGAISEVLNENRGDTTWSVTNEATKGSQENIRRLASGELDLALSNAAITYFAVRGAEGWEAEQPVQAVMTLAPNVALFLTRAGSEIEAIADLRGQRVVLGPAGAGFDFFLRPLLSAHGVEWEELSELHATQSGAVDMLADGSAAAAFLGGAVPTASITQATSSQDTFFIPYDPDAVAELTAEYPFFNVGRIPAGTYRGQDEDFVGLDVGSMHLITAASVDEQLVYELTRTIWENRDQVVEKHAAGRAINEGNVIRDTGTEFHPGAIRFWREIGIWPENEE